MRTRTLQRRAALETVSVEAFDGLDGQGLPSYAASADTEAWVNKDTEFLVTSDGSDIRISLTMHQPGDETPLIGEQDKLTYSGSEYIVEVADRKKSFDGTLDHVLVKARDK